MKVNDLPDVNALAAHGGSPGSPASTTTPWEQAWRYQTDLLQRSILFLDILRERANNMLAHEQASLPPLLDFEYETILDARRFKHPANYALLRITGSGTDKLEACVDESKPPVIILDPRAGHGPGIGGFKRDSEVGMALHEGHPVYFVIFFPEPCPGQTLADVLHALRRFVEEVSRRHDGKPPVLYGNCQAGWAVTLLSADCEGLVGPAVLNGSPLSYWAGESDANAMRLAGGLTGGAWIAHFLADLGNGRFDGAWLAQNFENLNPANTLWDKNYKVFANVDAERERFLEFERWWTGFYFLSREEITAIVENLFIGNKLESGEMRICEGCVVDLKRIRKPVLTDVVTSPGADENEMLRLAGGVEKSSEHPLAAAIVEGAAGRGLALPDAESFNAIPGHGIEARIGGRALLLGNLKLMRDRSIALGALEARTAELADDGKTPMYVAIDGKAAGIVAVADTVKDDSVQAIRALRDMGLEVVMITGDNERTAKAIGRRVGIERVLSEVLPQDKAHNVQKLQLEGKQVGMVGDGINDAPALAQADVGFAIGTGTDVAIAASDITLIKGSLHGVVLAMQISRATMRNVYQNLFGAFIYNTLGLPIALGVMYPFVGILLSPLLAAIAMAFSSVTVISNANRLKRWRAA